MVPPSLVIFHPCKNKGLFRLKKQNNPLVLWLFSFSKREGQRVSPLARGFRQAATA